jgi:hypothetical protein
MLRVGAVLCGWAIVGAPMIARAEAGSEAEAKPRRETLLTLGYGSISSSSFVRSDLAAGVPGFESSFTGWMLEVTGRRFPGFEYGFSAWSTGGSSDGKGSYAHVLMRFAVEARWLPWGFGRVEPWVGAALGLAAADDYAKWGATDSQAEHSLSVARLGDLASLDLGIRARLGTFFALGLRSGLLYMNLRQVREGVREPGDTKSAFVLRPTDYGRRIWTTLALTAEVTIPD